MRGWPERNAKAKRFIVCSLGAEPLSRFDFLINDGTAEYLWKQISLVYTTSNVQAIINLSQKLESLQFNQIDYWTKHLDRFQKPLTQLASYGSAIEDAYKTFKLLRTLSDSFALL